ncbi:exported hypothetical protein [Mesorhizobium plurifarium]|uniref:Uncharacterized protein n=1 Tax=Mesorhizobium plurifarium TaxID=69974 RepID=A0A090FQ85_MESPL|nr:exported hypothetical protein [Mesorhizobium plurifarium]
MLQALRFVLVCCNLIIVTLGLAASAVAAVTSVYAGIVCCVAHEYERRYGRICLRSTRRQA